jgi:hypothetical protein
MTNQHKPVPQFAICINTDDPDLLTPRMIYEVLPDESAAKHNYLRVVDNEGEDYLYPANYFVFIELPQVVEQVLLRLSLPISQGILVGSDRRVASARRRKTERSVA